MNSDLKTYIEAGLSALNERRNYLANELSKTTNPLDRLSIRDRLEELDNAIRQFSHYTDFLAQE